LIPIAEHFSVKAETEKMKKELLLEGLLMIYEKRSPLAVQEMMNSYLERSEKFDLLGIKGAA
jgi:flagellar motor component MotA